MFQRSLTNCYESLLEFLFILAGLSRGRWEQRCPHRSVADQGARDQPSAFKGSAVQGDLSIPRAGPDSFMGAKIPNTCVSKRSIVEL